MCGSPPSERAWRGGYRPSTPTKEIHMPVILWLLGVPISILLLLMLFGVV
jgi:hypothetical protein